VYETKLGYDQALGITTLEILRLRGDLIEVFKIVKGFVNIDRNIFSRRHSVIVRGIVRNCKRVCLGLMFVNFHLAKELSITGMHWSSMLLIVTQLTVSSGVWITILRTGDFYKLKLSFPFWSRLPFWLQGLLSWFIISAMLKHVIDIGWKSVRHTLARYQNGWTYCHDFFTTR